MTQEDKELLLKDLCARLPYGLKVKTNRGPEIIEGLAPFCSNEIKVELNFDWSLSISDYTPYLRPMSSMTEEEKKEYQAFFNYDGVEYPEEYIDWLNKKMFAYRTINGKDMFELGLALVAPDGMYK